MDMLLLVFKELAIIAGIIFLFILIVAMIMAPINAYCKKRDTEKAVNDFVNTLVDEMFKEEPKKTTKTKKTDEK